MSDPDYSPEMAGRLAKLETAISKGRTVRFAYWSIARDDERERTVNPLALLHDMSAWYVVGADLEDEGRRKKFRVSRASAATSASRRAASATSASPATSRSTSTGASRRGRSARSLARRVEVHGDTRRGGSPARCRTPARSTTASSRPYASVEPLAAWVLRQNGRAVPLEPAELREEVAAALARSASATRDVRRARGAGARREHPAWPERPPGPVAPERFGVLQALLAHLLAACGEAGGGARRGRPRRAFSITIEELEEVVAAEPRQLRRRLLHGLRGAERRRGARRQGALRRRLPAAAQADPLEARAIRLALEFVGPMIAADSRSPLDKVRGKLEETFGQFELAQTPEVPVETDEEQLVTTLSGAMEHHRVVRIEYLKEDEASRPRGRSRRTSSCASSRTGACTLGPRRGGRAPSGSTACARPSRRRDLRAAAGLRPELPPRPARGADPLREAGGALEDRAGARPLADGSAVADVPYSTEEWLVTEILADRGEAVVLEPEPLREVHRRACPRHGRELASARAPARRARPAARRSGRGPLPRPDPRPAAAGTRGPRPRGGRGGRPGSVGERLPVSRREHRTSVPCSTRGGGQPPSRERQGSPPSRSQWFVSSRRCSTSGRGPWPRGTHLLVGGRNGAGVRPLALHDELDHGLAVRPVGLGLRRGECERARRTAAAARARPGSSRSRSASRPGRRGRARAAGRSSAHGDTGHVGARRRARRAGRLHRRRGPARRTRSAGSSDRLAGVGGRSGRPRPRRPRGVAQLVLPPVHRARRPGDQQEDGARRGAERLHAEVDAVGADDGGDAVATGYTGRVKVKVEPSRAPNGRRASRRRLGDRARDEQPRPGRARPPTAVRPNFSKISVWCSAAMPGPSSRTVSARGRSHPRGRRAPPARPPST